MAKKKKPRKAYDDDEEIVSDGDRFVFVLAIEQF